MVLVIGYQTQSIQVISGCSTFNNYRQVVKLRQVTEVQKIDSESQKKGLTLEDYKVNY